MSIMAFRVRSEFPSRFETLYAGERLIVWSFRYWLACRKTERDPQTMLLDVFGHNGVTDAVCAVEDLLTLAVVEAKRPMDVRCTACPHLSADEGRLLCAVSAAQAGDAATVGEVLSCWFSLVSASRALPLLAELALLFDRAGLSLPLREIGPEPHQALASDATTCRRRG
jgi:hypothetical protein